MNEVALANSKRARITFRINPDVDARTHPISPAGLKSNKFWRMRRRRTFCTRLRASMPGIEVHGIECHISSELPSSPYVDALRRLLSLVDDLSARGIHLRHLDIGGGRAINYGSDTLVPMVGTSAVEREISGRHLDLLIERGRSIVGDAGLLLTRVGSSNLVRPELRAGRCSNE